MKRILIITRNPLVNTRQMKNVSGITDNGRYQFFINDAGCTPDFVAINSKALRQPTSFNVTKARTILVTDEPYSVLAYPKGYYSQFGTVVTTQRQIKPCDGTNVLYHHTLLPWYVGMTWEPDHSNRITMTYDDIRNARPQKQKMLSVVSSYKAFSRGHVERQRFVRRLVEHFGSSIDVFGEGIRDFRDKWDVVAPYRYQVVIENSCAENYWTEKLADCFLAGTYPLYHGCPNAAEFFPKQAFTAIDIRNADKALETIDRVLSDDLYTQRQEAMMQAKQLTLDQYNMFNALAEICDTISDASDGQTTLMPAAKFFSWHNFKLYSVGRTYYKLLNKLKP